MATAAFQSFWHGPLSSLERLCLTSFVSQGEEFHLYTYDDSLSVPNGVILKDASDIYPEEEIFTYQSGPRKGSVAVFANLFRYKLLYERGGWWVDTDVLYTGGKIPSTEIYLGLQHKPKSHNAVNNAIMRLPERSSIAKECINRIWSMGKEKAAASWGKAGPKLLTKVLVEKDQLDGTQPQSYAYPVPTGEAEAPYLPKRKKWVKEKVEGTPFLHLWNSILGKMGVQKEVRPPDGSYLDEQAKKLGFSWPCPDVQYSDRTIERVSENYRKAGAQDQLDQIKSSTTWKVVSAILSTRRKIGI